MALEKFGKYTLLQVLEHLLCCLHHKHFVGLILLVEDMVALIAAAAVAVVVFYSITLQPSLYLPMVLPLV
jgi:hypothetical protein